MERDAVSQLTHRLRVSGGHRRTIERELRAHLEETRRDLELSGVHPDEAMRQAQARLGDPEEIAEGFRHVYRPSRRGRVAIAFVLAGGLLLGVFGANGTLASSASGKHSARAHVVHRASVRSATHCHHGG